MTIRIGTRDSKLARWQAEWVAGQLALAGVETQLIFVKTLGDVKSGPIGTVGGQGVFTKEIQRALLERRVDLAVHSLKDLPTDAVDGLALAAVPRRESAADALIANTAGSLDELPPGAIVATGSARRRAQLLAHRPDLNVRDIRGNVDTRLQKLREDGLDAMILAEAGLRRLGLEHHITQVIPKTIMLPAVGQGALGLEIRVEDDATRSGLQVLDHATTHLEILAERSLLRALRGGCLAPVGAWARVGHTEGKRSTLYLDSVVLNGDGSERLAVSVSGPVDTGEQLGLEAAEQLLSQGANRLLETTRQERN